MCRRNELQALDLAITAFMSSLAFISMIGKEFNPLKKGALHRGKAAKQKHQEL